jgi:hypothetical protein
MSVSRALPGSDSDAADSNLDISSWQRPFFIHEFFVLTFLLSLARATNLGAIACFFRLINEGADAAQIGRHGDRC